jgi:hypothetical protein
MNNPSISEGFFISEILTPPLLWGWEIRNKISGKIF